MQKISTMTSLFVFATLIGLAACSGTDGGEEIAESGLDDRQVVTDYAEQSVVPTYETLDSRAGELKTAVDAFVEDATMANLTAAREAWTATRTPWEQSEAFLFGPVVSNGYDPALDSWPVDTTQLENVLESDEELTKEYVSSLDPGQKGFHTIEFLLFGDGGSKKPADFTDREIDYLKATTAELKGVTASMEQSWTSGLDGAEAYVDVFTGAGNEGNTQYPSLQNAGQEMVDGMLTIVDEVGNGKIADPFKERDTTLVESQFSFNSLTDFQNNITGVKHAYTSKSVAGTSGKSLSEWVKSKDAGLDSRVRTEIDDAIAAIGAIPEPFRDAITDEDGRQKIQTAMDKLATLQETLNGPVMKVVTGN